MSDRTGATIKVASYNMRKAIGTDRRRRPDRVLEVLKEVDADVVALQEADKRFGGRASAMPHAMIDLHGIYQPVKLGVSHGRLLQKIPGGIHAERFFRIDTRNIGWHGNALLVKRGVEVLHADALELPMFEPRGAVLAELLVGDKPLRVIGMHLDLTGLWRRRQMRAILEAIDQRPQRMPTVLMGDTNEWRAAAGCIKDLGSAYRLAPTGPSFHSRRPVAALDRIIVDKALAIDSAGTHHSDAARSASDHLPVWARLAV